MTAYLLVLSVGFFAGIVSGIIGTGASIVLLPLLVLQFGAQQAVPIMAVASVMGNVAKMASGVPMDRFPELVAWMFPLMGHDDRENMTRIWQMAMPEPAFEGAKGLIEKAIGGDWAELTKRIPALVG